MNNYYAYILSSYNKKVLYIGITSNLEKRIYEHKNKLIEGFTSKYNVNRLVYFEKTNDVNIALNREKQLKRWNRKKKEKLINIDNKDWHDLAEEWY